MRLRVKAYIEECAIGGAELKFLKLKFFHLDKIKKTPIIAVRYN